MKFKDCHFGQFGIFNARHYSRYYRVSGDLFRLTNRSKLVDGNLFVKVDLLLGVKSVTFYFIWRVDGWFSQKISKNKNIFFSNYI